MKETTAKASATCRTIAKASFYHDCSKLIKRYSIVSTSWMGYLSFYFCMLHRCSFRAPKKIGKKMWHSKIIGTTLSFSSLFSSFASHCNNYVYGFKLLVLCYRVVSRYVILFEYYNGDWFSLFVLQNTQLCMWGKV